MDLPSADAMGCAASVPDTRWSRLSSTTVGSSAMPPDVRFMGLVPWDRPKTGDAQAPGSRRSGCEDTSGAERLTGRVLSSVRARTQSSIGVAQTPAAVVSTPDEPVCGGGQTTAAVHGRVTVRGHGRGSRPRTTRKDGGGPCLSSVGARILATSEPSARPARSTTPAPVWPLRTSEAPWRGRPSPSLPLLGTDPMPP